MMGKKRNATAHKLERARIHTQRNRDSGEKARSMIMSVTLKLAGVKLDIAGNERIDSQKQKKRKKKNCTNTVKWVHFEEKDLIRLHYNYPIL